MQPKYPAAERFLPQAPDYNRLPVEQRQAAIEYDKFLAELTFNSKDIINNLTKISGENIGSRRSIVFVVEARIALAPPERKLPYLYLLDSIVKNIGGEYVQEFRKNIFNTYVNAYMAADHKVRMSMQKLLRLWDGVFGQQLCNLLWRKVQEWDAREVSNSSGNPTPSTVAPAGNPDTRKRTFDAVADPNHRNLSYSVNDPQQQMALGPATVSATVPATMPADVPAAVSSLSNIPLPNPGGLVDNAGVDANAIAQVNAQVQLLTHEVLQSVMNGQAPTIDQLNTLSALLTVQMQNCKDNEELNNVISVQAQIDQLKRQQEQEMQTAQRPGGGEALTGVRTALSMAQNLQGTGGSQSAAATNQFDVTSHGYSTGNAFSYASAQNANPVQVQILHNPLTVSGATMPAGITNMSGSAQIGSVADVLAGQDGQPDVACESFSKIKSVKHTAAVKLIYDNLPHVSKQDGTRFANVEALREHLDWLFKRNMRKTTRQQGGVSRSWYIALNEWISGIAPNVAPKLNAVEAIFKENSKKSEQVAEEKVPLSGIKLGVVSDDNDDAECPVCGEKFDTFWDEDEQAWKYEDAVRTSSGQVVHIGCAGSPLPELAQPKAEATGLEQLT